MMNIKIKLKDTISNEDSALIKKIGEKISSYCNEELIYENVSQDGIKDGGLTIGISIVSLGFAAISTIFNVLQYFSSKNPNYEMTVVKDNIKFSINNLSEKQIIQKISKINQKDNSSDIEVFISHITP